MSISRRRVGAILRKELHEYRHNGAIVTGMAILPLLFVLPPLVDVLGLPSATSAGIPHDFLLLYTLGIPALVPSVLAPYSVVGERQQGTLEPVLTTPIRREEFVLAKALAAFVPSVGISYVIFALVVAIIELFAQPGIAGSVVRAPEVLAQLAFTPLIAGFSIWVGMWISARSSDVRVAQQLGALAALPLVAMIALVSYGAIHPTLTFALGAGLVLAAADRLGWRVTSSAFDRERLISGSK